MPNRAVIHTSITLLFFAAIIFSFSYGPAARKYTAPDKTFTVLSANELAKTWQSYGVHGRVAVIFARHLKPQPEGGFPEIDYLERALNEGVVRRVNLVVPDAFWPQINGELIKDPTLIMPPYNTDVGLRLLHVVGRINVMPLSKFIPDSEQALIVYEPGVWSYQEQTRIEGLIKSKQLATDLQVIVAANAVSPVPSFPKW